MSVHLLIATPAHDRKVTVPYLESLFNLQKTIAQQQLPIELSLKTVSYAIIDMARNYLATLILEEKKYSHILFIDSDQGFPPELILDMLDLHKPVVSTVIPARKIDFTNVWSRARKLDTPDRLLSLASSFLLPDIKKNEQGQIGLNNGFVEVGSAGTGIMLIKRQVIETMAELPDMMGEGFQPLMREGYSGRILQCFRPLISKNNLPMGEDMSFCKRWVDQCKGEIWSNVMHEITHVGPFEFKARLIDRFIDAGLVPETILNFKDRTAT